MLTYLRLAKARQGLIMNFNVPYLKEGIRSVLPPRLHPREVATPDEGCEATEYPPREA